MTSPFDQERGVATDLDYFRAQSEAPPGWPLHNRHGVRAERATRRHIDRDGRSRHLPTALAPLGNSLIGNQNLSSSGTGPGVTRLSIGIETAENIFADLEQALAKAA